MVDIEHANAYSEVLEIIKTISEEDYNKIPKIKIDVLEMYSNKDYHFQYNPEKTLDEQNVSKITKIIIGILFRDYWADDNQRKKIIARQNCERAKVEEEKSKKYRIDDIFKNNKENEELALVEIKNTKWYEKIVLFFRELLTHK